MINTMNPARTPGHSEQKGEVLDKLVNQYSEDQKPREAVKKLGKDEFFKIMVTQMQHQDPMKPMENEQMAAQMAQFSALEQMLNVNQNLEKLAQSQMPLQQLGAASLIGKFVTADSSRVIHVEGKKTELKFEIPQDAKTARVVVLNEKGENVREIDAGSLKKGLATVPWDGKRTNGLAAPGGNYSIQVSATDENGRPMGVLMTKTEVVNGVGFEGKDTVLYTGDANNPKKMLLKNVSRIVDPSKNGSALTTAAAENPFQAMLQQQGGDGQNVLPQGFADKPEITQGAGESAKYTPFAGPGQEERLMSQALLDAQKAQRMEDANPAAQEMAQGNLNGQQAQKKESVEGFEGINPAAQKFAKMNLNDIPEAVNEDSVAAAQENSAGKSIPSMQEGSTAGKWNE